MVNILMNISQYFPELKDFDFMNFLMVYIVPFTLTFIASFFVGLERQNHGKAAGISSHVLVAMSTCALAILQTFLFNENPEHSDRQRLISYAVSGVGFMGAGTIIKDKFTVSGLTTAATIWTVAFIGITFGSGYIILGSILSMFVISFLVIRDVSRHLNPFKRHEDDVRKKEFDL